MPVSPDRPADLTCSLGLDLGSSGARLALAEPPADPSQGGGSIVWEAAIPYPGPFEAPGSWQRALIALVAQLPESWRQRVGALAIDGTSGTLLLCHADGSPVGGDQARALPYHLACPEHAVEARALVGMDGPAASASGSLARALRLLSGAAGQGIWGPLLLRHQADWLMGWLLEDWRWGEEGNNLRLGWDACRQAWAGELPRQSWAEGLPAIRPSGTLLGRLGAEAACRLDLPADCQVVAGSTDANAGVLAALPGPGDGVCVLGTTLVLKQFVESPRSGPGLSCHRVAGRWLLGGASNAGAGILRRFFSDAELTRLSRQIDPDRPSGLRLRPLPGRGERFPVDDPDLEPVLEPRPVSDALYLQALLEGLSAIEAAGWERLRQEGAAPLQQVITIGGGARNPQWRQLRQRLLGIPVLNRPGLTAAQGMAQLALRSLHTTS